MPKKPAKLNDAVHIDDFMDFKREIVNALEITNRRVVAVEDGHSNLEMTMTELKSSLTTVHKAIMGDIEVPEKPGMAENVRSLTSDMRDLVQMHKHELETALAKKAENENHGHTETNKPSMIESVSWKAITIALGVIGGLIAIIWKLLPMIPIGG